MAGLTDFEAPFEKHLTEDMKSTGFHYYTPPLIYDINIF